MLKPIAAYLVFFAAFNLGLATYANAEEAASPLAELEGIWRSSDYGEIFVVKDGQIKEYQMARQFCVAPQENEDSLADYVDQVAFSADGQSVLLSATEEPYPYHFRRLSALPEACLNPVSDTVQGNFDVFVDTYTTFYPFFGLYNVDWDARVQDARSKLRPDMSDAELFQLFKAMLKDVDDAHIEITGEVEGDNKVFKGNLGKTELALFKRADAAGENPFKARNAYRQKYWFEDLKNGVHEGQGMMGGDESIQYGLVSGDIGMISLITMGGYIEEEGQSETQALNAALDKAMALFKQRGVKAVIVNLAMNYGGYDYISRALASRFAAAPAKAYTKWSAQNPAGTRFAYEITPAEAPRFEGPVYLLTSDVSVSAAEIATMSLRALPNVTHAGEATRGALSDVLSMTLPNGWELSLSSEVYEDHRGVLWEGKGIAPEIEIPVFNIDDPTKGFLEAVDTLVGVIDERHG